MSLTFSSLNKDRVKTHYFLFLDFLQNFFHFQFVYLSHKFLNFFHTCSINMSALKTSLKYFSTYRWFSLLEKNVLLSILDALHHTQDPSNHLFLLSRTIKISLSLNFNLLYTYFKTCNCTSCPIYIILVWHPKILRMLSSILQFLKVNYFLSYLNFIILLCNILFHNHISFILPNVHSCKNNTSYTTLHLRRSCILSHQMSFHLIVYEHYRPETE